MNLELKDKMVEESFAYLVKNPEEISKTKVLKNLLLNKDKIIYYYLEQLYKDGLKLTESLLQYHIMNDAPIWLGYSKKLYSQIREEFFGVISEEYIQEQIEETLIAEEDYIESLIYITMERYKELVNYILPTEFSITNYLTPLGKFYRYDLGLQIITDAVTLHENPRGTIFNNKTYKPQDIYDYLKDRLEDKQIDTAIPLSESNTYGDSVLTAFLEGAKSKVKAFDWNIGKLTQIPTLHKGDLLSIIGQPKVGKSSIAIGEIVYPLIISGKSVAYYSCEMSEASLYNKLMLKHLYSKYNVKVQPKIAFSYLIVSLFKISRNLDDEYLGKVFGESVRRKSIAEGKRVNQGPLLTEEEYKKASFLKDHFKNYFTIDNSLAESIMLAYHDLFTSGKYGNLYILREEKSGVSLTELNPFIVEDMFSYIQELLNKTEGVLDGIIIDHAAHFKSLKMDSSNMTPIITEVYKQAKDIAENKEHPLFVCVINHTNKAFIKDDLDAQSTRAHGTSESGKTADLEIILYQTPEDLKDGIVSLRVQYSRDEQINTKDPVIKMYADRGVCDFTAIQDTKGSYNEQ